MHMCNDFSPDVRDLLEIPFNHHLVLDVSFNDLYVRRLIARLISCQFLCQIIGHIKSLELYKTKQPNDLIA